MTGVTVLASAKSHKTGTSTGQKMLSITQLMAWYYAEYICGRTYIFVSFAMRFEIPSSSYMVVYIKDNEM